jgi:nitrite reductase/ring-hydroxylating ferredoxin subunit
LAVFDVEGELWTVENACIHIGSPLDDGAVEDRILTCPWHGWRYDLTTGQHLTAFGRRAGLRTFRTRAAGDEVEVEIDG